jgi:peroxiredoxin
MKGNPPKLMVTASLFLAAACTFAQTTQSAERLVQQIRAIKNPSINAARSGDAEYLKQHREATRQAIRQRGALIFSLFKEDPENLVLTEFLPQRWMELEILADNEENLAQILRAGIKEIEDFLLPPQNLLTADLWPTEHWHQMCLYWRGRMVIRLNRGNWPAQIGVVMAYIQETPHSLSTHSELLLQAAFQAPSPIQAAEAYRIILKNYPYDPLVPTVRGLLKRIEGVGQPFSFTLTDPKTRKKLSIDDYRGKLVLLDFFRHAPEKMSSRIQRLKSLKAAHQRDLVIISVCVDSALGPDAKALEGRVLKWALSEKIDWLVAVPGETAQSDFLTAWHMTALPESFLVDRQGKLVKLGYGMDVGSEVEALLKR